MNNELRNFVDRARAKGWSDDTIREKLMAAGWAESEVSNVIQGDLVVPKPPASANQIPSGPAAPMAVVENLTPRGFEYKIFSVALTVSVYALLLMANFMISGSEGGETAFPLTLLIVTGPIAIYMFKRLKTVEARQPEIRHDPSRRKSIQAILLTSFLGVVGHTVFLIYMIISGHYSSTTPDSYGSYSGNGPNLGADILRWLVTVIVAGSVFLYYWRDEHRDI